MEVLRILIVAEDPLVRERLAVLLAKHADLTIVGQIAADKNLLRQIDFYFPDIVLWDFGVHPEGSRQQLDNLPNISAPIVALIANEAHLAEIRMENLRGLLPREIEVENLAAALLVPKIFSC
jgi:DNA-binding NarL/FixJ family response regulator